MGRFTQRIYQAWYSVTDPHKHLRGLDIPPGLDPRLHETLMKHQRIGVAWLHQHTGKGVVLADDMGLGKTIQALAYLQATNQDRAARHHERGTNTLVVCPPTLLQTWVDEAARFTPELKVASWRPSKRGPTLAQMGRENDVVVISYDAMARAVAEQKALVEAAEQEAATSQETSWTSRDQMTVTQSTVAIPDPIRWQRVIFDEAQLLKNNRTKRHKMANELAADGKIALTGTPIENSLGDLWALLRIINPELIRGHDRRSFGTYYRNRLGELNTLTRDHVLSRDKKRLRRMLGLPKKLEEKVLLDMPARQMAIYRQVAAGELAKLKEQSGEGASFSKVHLFAMLSHLKQVANSPELLGLEGPSAKHSWLNDRMEGLNEPVVMFSQYRKMLGITRQQLEKTGWAVTEINGDMTPAQRAKVLSTFRADANPKRTLLISLRAGGTGITVTESRLVIHLDRWWNPAVEDQASDRLYRIGQKRDVTVITLTCRGTLEENIDRIIDDKRALQEVIETQDAAAIERMVLGGDFARHTELAADPGNEPAAAMSALRTPAQKLPSSPALQSPLPKPPTTMNIPPRPNLAPRSDHSQHDQLPDEPYDWRR